MVNYELEKLKAENPNIPVDFIEEQYNINSLYNALITNLKQISDIINKSKYNPNPKLIRLLKDIDKALCKFKK